MRFCCLTECEASQIRRCDLKWLPTVQLKLWRHYGTRVNNKVNSSPFFFLACNLMHRINTGHGQSGLIANANQIPTFTNFLQLSTFLWAFSIFPSVPHSTSGLSEPSRFLQYIAFWWTFEWRCTYIYKWRMDAFKFKMMLPYNSLGGILYTTLQPYALKI